MGKDRRRLGGALGASAAVHGALAVLLLVFGIPSAPEATPSHPDEFKYIYIASPGSTGGGGGRTSPRTHTSPAPDRAVQATTAVATNPAPVPVTPAVDMSVSTDPTRMLQMFGGSVGTFSRPGGPGRGTGDGPGRGPGTGPGEDGNRGGGPRQVGDGVTSPQPLVQVKPQYTSDAMRARIQGSVTLEVVVKADGTVGAVRLVKSLDRLFGLDDAAVRAARQWTFKPGTFEGKPVDVLVHIVLDFRIQ